MSDTLTIQLDLPGTGLYAKAAEVAPVTETPVNRNTATDAQMRFIRTLLAEREGHPVAEAIRKALNDIRDAGRLNKKAASKAIEELKALPRQAQATATVAPQAVRPNKYRKACEHCGRMVEAEKGALAKGDDGSWIVTHVGECPTAFEFPEGRYALRDGDDVKFYHAMEDGYIYALASDEHHRLQADAQERVTTAIAADPMAAAALYGQEIGVCGRCNRQLTDATSRSIGLGPVCREKGDW